MSDLYRATSERPDTPPNDPPTVCASCGATARTFETDGWEELANGDWLCPACIPVPDNRETHCSCFFDLPAPTDNYYIAPKIKRKRHPVKRKSYKQRKG